MTPDRGVGGPSQPPVRFAQESSATRYSRLVAVGPTDPLEDVAWKSGMLLEDFHSTASFGALSEAARADG